MHHLIRTIRQGVFPAPAGINRMVCTACISALCVPRASGDKPGRTAGDHD
ncbi:hypothetical protein G5019_001606 [Salmonella enterica subsp. enterica]|nr:hypothetical protein [Salmonella enterica subsp. enterica]EGX6532625.1 hypothetical protein [Salmonella enterica subsp. enterica serovar Senftenberg]EEN6031854.1 hypothetical protein [Salmonella enterica subsp. enterica]EEN8996134.1 hypothetical protein [Salmonella enterica subsp. enterica]EEN9065568.1 hypothetical protein [Salmonella enterica subsp. enterica]